MSALIQPITLLLIIAAGYLFKRFGLFGDRDYRVIQKAEFNLILPGAIIYSFATSPARREPARRVGLRIRGGSGAHTGHVRLLAAQTRGRPRVPDAQRVGVQRGLLLLPGPAVVDRPAALVPAAMFDVGNCVMVSAGTNVMTQTLLHIQPGRTLAEQGAGEAPTLPYTRPADRDARRLARRALLRNVVKGFASSPSFDTYVLMIVLMIAGVTLPEWLGTFCQPFSNANAFCSMLMVGMLMDLPASRHDVRDVLEILAGACRSQCSSPRRHGSCCRSMPSRARPWRCAAWRRRRSSPRCTPTRCWATRDWPGSRCH